MVIHLADPDEKNLEKLSKEKNIDTTEMVAHLIHIYMAAEAGRRTNYCTGCGRNMISAHDSPSTILGAVDGDGKVTWFENPRKLGVPLNGRPIMEG